MGKGGKKGEGGGGGGELKIFLVIEQFLGCRGNPDLINI